MGQCACRPRVVAWIARCLGLLFAVAVFGGILPGQLNAAAGQLWSFGQNHDGQLGDGTTTNRNSPAQVLTGIAAAAAGGSATEGSHSLFLKGDGTLWSVGYNLYGQLGDGTTTSRTTLVQIATGVSSASCGINHSLFLKADGTLWAMGYNQYGQLGDGTTVNRATPMQVASGVSAVAAGGNHTLFLKTDGTLWATGYNPFGQLGDGTKVNKSTPVQIASGVTTMAAGGSHSLFLKTDGTLWVTGWNASGQLGIGPASSSVSTPVQLTTGVTAIAAGNQHSLFVKTDGTLWSMGQNLFGQLGDGTMPTNQKYPVQVSGQVGAVAAGGSHSLFVKTDGTLWSMGLNTSGQLGDGTTNNRTLPVQVTDEVLAAAAGSESSFYVKAPGLTSQLNSWTALASPPANNLQNVTFQNGLFVIGASGIAPAGSGGLTMVSSAGSAWTSSSAGALSNIDVFGSAFGSGLFVAVGANETGGGGLITTSTDGLAWSAGTAAGQPLKSIVSGNNLFVAVGDGGLIQTSADGLTWTARGSGTGNGVRGVTAGAGQFVAVGSAGTILTSTDGTTWTARSPGASGVSNNFASVAYGNGQFVAVGNGISTSTDGVTWVQRVAAASDGTNYYAVSSGFGQYVAVGVNSSAQSTIISSPDGVTWTSHSPGTTAILRGVCYGGNRIVVVGDNGTVLTSGPIGSAPVIATDPVSQSVPAGSFVSFSVTAVGAQPFSYQWRRNNVNIVGATNAVYSVAAADTADAGSLTVVVTNAAGSVTSAAATLTVLKANQTISFAALPTHFYGDAAFTLTATASPSGLPVTFSVVSGPASVVGNTVSITGVGSVTIRASQAGNLAYYAAPNVDRTFSVGKGTPVISWPSPTAITYGTALSSMQLNATSNVAGTFTYSPATGAVLDIGTRTLGVTFTPTDSADYFITTAQQTITISKAVAVVTLDSLTATYDGTAHAATATTSAGALAISFTYDGSSTVPVNAGSYVVVGTIVNPNYSGSATGTLTIAKAAQTLTFAPIPDRTLSDPPLTLSAASSVVALPVTFTVLSGPATVAGGIVTPTGVGSVSIRASQLGNLNYLAAADVIRNFTVFNPPPVITWPTPAGITYGTPLSTTQLNATASVPGTFVYSPAAGVILNAGAPTLTATFTPTDTANYAAVTVQRTLTVAKAVPVLTWATPNAIVCGTQLDSTQLNASAGAIAGSFTYSPGAGSVLNVGQQTLSATFSPIDSSNYATASIQQTLTVTKGVATVTLGGLSATYDGTPKSGSATTSVGAGSFNFTYDGSANAPTAVGSYLVVATLNDPNYSGSASGMLTITKADQIINFSAIPDHALGDAPFGLAATASPSSLPVTFTLLSGPATLAGNLVTVTGVGPVTIRASQPGDNNYKPAANADRVFTIGKAKPVVTWPTPGVVSYGTALSTLQLNATADVPGTFSYSPGAGTVPSVGSVTLTVLFTPTDTTRYGTATAQQTLTVSPEGGAPYFTTQPQSHAAFVGDSLTLVGVATGIPAPTYQWEKGGVKIAGATSPTLVLANIQLRDAGLYALVASNLAGSTTSSFAQVAVLVPQSNAITYEATVSSTGVTAGGVVNLSYLLTNIGTQTWGSNHYLSARDGNGSFVAFTPLAGVPPGEKKIATLRFTAPTTPGNYTYVVQGLESGVEFFSTQVVVTLTVLAPQANSTTYNATNFPISAAPGSVLNFNYNVTNTGTKDWGATHFLSLKDANGVFLNFASLNAVAPGQSKTVNLTFTAPATPGTYQYLVQAMEGGVEFFNTQVNLTLTVLAPQANAVVYTPTRYPDNVTPGATINLRYSLSNAGTAAWGANHYVSLRDGNNAYLGFIPLSGVAAGDSMAVEFNIVAPTTPGTYTYYVQALESGVEFFTSQDLVTLTVLPVPIPNAIAHNATTFPGTVKPGTAISISCDVTNRGTKAWGANHYLSLRDADNTFLGFPTLNGTAPGGSKSVGFDFVAPSTPGLYTYHIQAFETGIEFFNMSDTLVLIVK